MSDHRPLPALLPSLLPTSWPTSSLSHLLAAGTLSGLLAAVPAAAQQNIGQLKRMEIAASDRSLPAVPQTGQDAETIRQNLQRIRLPPGFSIGLYALVPGARQIAVAPNAPVLFVGTRRSTVWAVTQRHGGDTASEVKAFAPGLKFNDPNGVCWTKDGALVIAELNRVLVVPAAASFANNSTLAVAELVPQGQLVPPAEESRNHGARTCRIGPDGKLYVTLGQPFNVPPAGKLKRYRELGIGGIVRMALDGSQREVYAVGVRNSVGQDFNPKDGTLWFTDNQTDGLGDGVPPGELNRITKAGQDFGYPYWNGHFKVAGSAAAPDLKNLPEPAGAVFPQIEFLAHQAQLGMSFYTGQQFPAQYRGGIFVAAHGSWNSTVPTGALLNFVSLKADGTADRSEVFADGWLDAAGDYRGRPVDVAVMQDGSLLISDDFAGALYRVTYRAP